MFWAITGAKVCLWVLAYGTKKHLASSWKLLGTFMGVATGGMLQGMCSQVQNSGGYPPEIVFFKVFFEYLLKFLDFPIFPKVKWAKFEEKSEFGGRWFRLTWTHPSTQDPYSRQKFVAMPLGIFSYICLKLSALVQQTCTLFGAKCTKTVQNTGHISYEKNGFCWQKYLL